MIVLDSFHRLLLRPCLGDEGLSDLYVFLLVLNSIAWIMALLLQCGCAGIQNVCFPERFGPNGDFFWFDLKKA